MDDDIDIEEHDVMDNPRIKSIFPDLSRVKIEIPDDDDEVLEEHFDDEPTGEQSQEMHYQYEYSFETSTDNIPEQNEDHSDGDHNYFCNEIILGSKPPVDQDVLYEEALNSHPIVYVENWELKLKTSPCFCETCDILFPTVNALDAHKMISHSYLVALDIPQKNTARKSTVTSKYCNHCSKTFPDDTSLIKHLYELLPLNNFPQAKEDEEQETSDEFMCQKCNKTFPNYNAGRWHRKTVHPNIPLQRLIINVQRANKIELKKQIKIEPQVKVEPKEVKLERNDAKEVTIQPKPKIEAKIQPKLKIETKIQPKLKIATKKDLKVKLKGKREGKFFESSSLVPKSTVFQCNVCQIGFMSCFSAIQHSHSCEKTLPSEKCGVCKRKIRAKDAKIHELQHNYTDKLKIYTVYKNMYERILCKCPKCTACFDELGFWCHYQRCKKTEKKLTTHCSECDLNIACSRYESHIMKHSSKKLTKKEFIVVEFYDQDNIKAIKEAQTELRVQKMREKIKKESLEEEDDKKIVLYYCQFCGCCMAKLNNKGHSDGSCKQSKINLHKQHCEKCGLCFSAKSITTHAILHQNTTFSLKDIKFYCLETGQEIDPPMSELFKCKLCERHFLYRKLVRRHDCETEKHITCKICSKKFNLQAYKVHKIFHTVDKLLPELMKKYNSINNMWNVLYMCSICDLITMAYDSAVTHSQGHLNYIISDFHKICEICDLKIAEKDYQNHENLHENNQTIERKSFRILKYDYKDLFKQEWMDLFNPLPNQHKLQILSKSIYRYTRSVKMQIEVSASTDNTKYFCMNCKAFVEGPVISSHIKSKCTRNTKFCCNVCSEVYKSLKLFLTHYETHITEFEHENDENTIVTFNNECDQDFNIHLSMIEAKTKNVEPAKTKNTEQPKAKTKNTKLTKSKLQELLADGVKKAYKIYKCAKCQVCVSLQSSIRRHHCMRDEHKRFCDICQQYFSHRKFGMHMEAHRKKPSVNKNTLTVEYFNCEGKKPNLDDESKIEKPNKILIKKSKESATKNLVAKIFKCDCGLHFTSMKTVQKHLNDCSPDSEISKETCSKCKLLFPTEVLVTHLVNHHSKEMKIQIENVAKFNLFKCPNCSLFFTNTDNFNEHTEKCDPTNGRKCEKCHLNFGKKCFGKHKCSTKDTTYINKITTVKKSVNFATIYKCGPCDICYLSYKAFQYHVLAVKHENKITLLNCKQCGLRFTKKSMQRHEKIHNLDKDEYTIKVIDPVNGESSTIVGNNNVDVDGNPRKRKHDDNTKKEIESALPKKAKLSLNNSEIMCERTRRRMNRSLEIPSTSKDYIDIDDTDTELTVPDISELTNDSMTSEIINSSIDKMEVGLSDKVKANLFVSRYNKRLYKCVRCQQHFMKDGSLYYHLKCHKHEEVTENFKCNICDFDFSRNTLPRHKYVHHEIMQLKKEDFEIITGTLYSGEFYKQIDLKASKNNLKHDKTVCNLNKSIGDKNVNEISEQCSDDVNVSSENSVSDIIDSKITQNDSEISTNASELTESDSATTKNDSEKMYYYKCANCNVCFIDQIICYEHTLKHAILDPKTYIECKICNFQFLIDSLKEHMEKHHSNDFLIENLIIHEYKSLGDGLDPKIDIFLAVDKVQSRLVSTTTDVGIV